MNKADALHAKTRVESRATTPTPATSREAPARVVIEGVTPQIDAGRFAVKRVVGEKVVVKADVFVDGHDVITCVLLFRKEEDSQWTSVPMQALVNDRWRGEFEVTSIGRYRYTLRAWIDRFGTWRRDLQKKIGAGQDVKLDLVSGSEIVRTAAGYASGEDAKKLEAWARVLANAAEPAQELALGDELESLVRHYPDTRCAGTYERELPILVDRDKARCSAWYEFFPRSCSPEEGGHGTFRDCEARLAYVASMGFDVVYLPPIHPIGQSHRKGKNNAVQANPDDTGSPWAIGGPEGGHKAIHPQLGTLADFEHFVAQAAEHGIEIALDIAYQCSPDHPYVKEHPDWFRHRADGSVQYAENPPKKYEDIYPIDFESETWHELAEELKSVVQFWIDHGVRIFRVDNPHTKPFHFWEWLIGDIKSRHPDVLFLSEAFTRPRIMHRLAKLGFTQSYTYFSWRNTKPELTQYFTEITKPHIRDFYRPNLWPNTPDILTEYLQYGGRPAFMTRFALAATLGANYGIYGPAFELCENRPREARSEEYLNSEKYEIRDWDLERPDSIKDYIGRINQIRRENPALHNDWSLQFHPIDNPELICYSKNTDDFGNLILVVVNLDYRYTQAGWVDLPLDKLGLDLQQPFQVHDCLTGSRYLWHGPKNYVQLDPKASPAHIFRIRRRLRTEEDFEYYL